MASPAPNDAAKKSSKSAVTMEAYDALLKDVIDAKRLSGTKVQQLTELAMRLLKNDLHLLSTHYRHHLSLPPSSPSKISSLYVLDSLSRAARSLYNKNYKQPKGSSEWKGAQYARGYLSKVEGVLEGMAADMCAGGWVEGKEKMRKIYDIWSKNSTFPTSTLDRVAVVIGLKAAPAPPSVVVPVSDTSGTNAVAGPSKTTSDQEEYYTGSPPKPKVPSMQLTGEDEKTANVGVTGSGLSEASGVAVRDQALPPPDLNSIFSLLANAGKSIATPSPPVVPSALPSSSTPPIGQNTEQFANLLNLLKLPALGASSTAVPATPPSSSAYTPTPSASTSASGDPRKQAPGGDPRLARPPLATATSDQSPPPALHQHSSSYALSSGYNTVNAHAQPYSQAAATVPAPNMSQSTLAAPTTMGDALAKRDEIARRLGGMGGQGMSGGQGGPSNSFGIQNQRPPPSQFQGGHPGSFQGQQHPPSHMASISYAQPTSSPSYGRPTSLQSIPTFESSSNSDRQPNPTRRGSGGSSGTDLSTPNNMAQPYRPPQQRFVQGITVASPSASVYQPSPPQAQWGNTHSASPSTSSRTRDRRSASPPSTTARSGRAPPPDGRDMGSMGRSRSRSRSPKRSGAGQGRAVLSGKADEEEDIEIEMEDEDDAAVAAPAPRGAGNAPDLPPPSSSTAIKQPGNALDSFDWIAFDGQNPKSWSDLSSAYIATHGREPTQMEVMMLSLEGMQKAIAGGSGGGAGAGGSAAGQEGAMASMMMMQQMQQMMAQGSSQGQGQVLGGQGPVGRGQGYAGAQPSYNQQPRQHQQYPQASTNTSYQQARVSWDDEDGAYANYGRGDRGRGRGGGRGGGFRGGARGGYGGGGGGGGDGYAEYGNAGDMSGSDAVVLGGAGSR